MERRVLNTFAGTCVVVFFKSPSETDLVDWRGVGEISQRAFHDLTGIILNHFKSCF